MSKYTKEKCHELSKKCSSRNEFKHLNNSAYNVARKNGYIDEICSHMTEKCHKWTKEECYELSKRCSSRSEFAKKYKNPYTYSRRYKWLDEICSHMVYLGDRYNRGIYSYKIEYNNKKYAYSGLTCNFERRHKEHLKNINGIHKIKCTIDTFCRENNIKLPMYEIAYDYMDVNNAKLKEYENMVELDKQGYIILNKSKCGGLGGNLSELTKEKCQELSLLCKTRKEFYKKYNSAYKLSGKNNWLDEICSHMIILKRSNEYWTKEICHKSALKYSSRSQFKKLCYNIYDISSKHGWLDEICSHMENKYYKWTKEECHKLSLLCKTRKEFYNKYKSAYYKSHRNNWLDEICSHMENKYYKWTKEKCLEISLQCKTKREFEKLNRKSFRYAQNHNFIDEICSHMVIK